MSAATGSAGSSGGATMQTSTCASFPTWTSGTVASLASEAAAIIMAVATAFFDFFLLSFFFLGSFPGTDLGTLSKDGLSGLRKVVLAGLRMPKARLFAFAKRGAVASDSSASGPLLIFADGTSAFRRFTLDAFFGRA